MEITPYKIESVETIDPPEGMPDGEWCRYTIGQGHSKIVCIRPGSVETVTQHAEDYAKELNERFISGSSPYSQRKPVKK